MESIFCKSTICSVLLAFIKLLLVLESKFSIGKLGTPELLPAPAAAIFLFEDLFFPFEALEVEEAF